MLVADQQLLVGAAGSIEATFLSADGEPVAATGTVTVVVTRADGTAVTVGTPTAGTETGKYTATITASVAGTLDVLTAVWSDNGVARVTTRHEIVGGYYFTLGEARASDPTLQDAASYTSAAIRIARSEVEREAEEITGVAHVPRFAEEILDGDGSATLLLPRTAVRAVRAVLLDGVEIDDLATLRVSPNGRLVRSTAWPLGERNVTVQYEHGYDRPNPEIKRAALTRLRHRLNFSLTGVPDRAVNFSAGDGGTFQLATAGRYATGIPEVDAVYARYSQRVAGLA